MLRLQYVYAGGGGVGIYYANLHNKVFEMFFCL